MVKPDDVVNHVRRSRTATSAGIVEAPGRDGRPYLVIPGRGPSDPGNVGRRITGAGSSAGWQRRMWSWFKREVVQM